MKKTGSIRVEIEEEYDRLNYTVNIMGVYQGRLEDEQTKIAVILPKSAVTDIREEVDWSKVKKGTLVIDIEQTIVWFFIKIDNDIIYVSSNYRGSFKDDICGEFHAKNIIPFDQWLKEYGNKEDGDE